ncbi:aldo/keto reductase [Leifsonia sp. F6_8S_P_1B]|uniref:Aldo/keto reductase n=1 Tax=Leifsonia williamsii TaxID=3035919 RepID=A0ABT8KA43_9MICO|nr:aldo/keto reductase [Leifsonia williamsii]MDN4614284.1 aldo/keto reductase [Leifsonia williamsii]
MQYRSLGRTGIQVTPYALGAMMLGSFGNPDRQEGVRIIHRALDAGINFVDTADRYGDSEEVVGEAIAGRRDEVVLATKFWGPVDDDINHRGASRRWIMQAVERSLRNLRTDHIDLYQLHRPDPDTDIEETLSALTDLVRQGKVRAIGSSSMRGSEIVEAQWASERRGFERFRTEQPNYSILDREIEREILPVAQRYGMGTLVYSPLAGGALTGKYRAGAANDNFRAGTGMRHFRDERRLAAIEQLLALADEVGIPLTHLAMAFTIAHPGVTSAIAGPRTMEQLEDTLAGMEVSLTDDILDRIDAIVPPGESIGAMDMVYRGPEVADAGLRRRPVGERAAA